MKDTVREIGLASLGLGVTIKEKVKSLGKKFVRKGEENEKRILSAPKEKLRSSARFAGKEALAISKKSLSLLERELKKIKAKTKKVGKAAKKVVKKKVSERSARKKSE